MTDLNERAARAIGWVKRPDGWYSLDGKEYPSFKTDRNHARLLVAEVERRDRAEGRGCAKRRWAVVNMLDVDWYNYPFDLLEIDPTDLTLACCEVLEANPEQERQ